MRTIGLDTSVLMHLLPYGAPSGQEDDARQARALIAGGQFDFVVGAPTIAEVLVHVPGDRRATVVEVLERMCRVHAFDTEAAIVAARLWPHRPRGSGKNERQVIKADLQIAAIALHWGVKGFCTFEHQQAQRVLAVAPHLEVGPPSKFMPQEPLPLTPKSRA